MSTTPSAEPAQSPTGPHPPLSRVLPTASSTSPTPAPREVRDPWFDNAKMLLVTLVVVGHALVMLPETPLKTHLYDFLYAWHMPAFVLVTGALSRHFAYSRTRLWALVRSVAVPYVLMEAAMGAFRIVVGGEHLDQLWAESHWPMWFLPALFFWRLATPVLRRLGGWAIVLAVAISLVGGYVGFDYLAMHRVLGFLPFFVVGLCLTPRTLEMVRSVPARIVGAGVLLGVWALTAQTDAWAQTRWFYYDWSYGSLVDSEYPALLTRAAVIGLGLAGALAALSLVPRQRRWFTRMGTASLVVYLCHGFVIKAVEYTPYPDWAAVNHQLALLINVVAAVGLAVLLASPWVARRLEPAVDPLTYAEGRVTRVVQLHHTADRFGAPLAPAMSRR